MRNRWILISDILIFVFQKSLDQPLHRCNLIGQDRSSCLLCLSVNKATLYERLLDAQTILISQLEYLLVCYRQHLTRSCTPFEPDRPYKILIKFKEFYRRFFLNPKGKFSLIIPIYVNFTIDPTEISDRF